AEYGPPALALTPRLGLRHLLGAGLLAAWAGLVVGGLRRRPPLAFALVWTALALLPVSNLLPSGVILAERTLFLPSAGMMLAAGVAWDALRERAGQPLARAGLGAATALVAGLGLVKSWDRSAVWRDQDTFFDQLPKDAPRTYRAHKVVAQHLVHSGRRREAEGAWRRALELYEGDPVVREELGQLYRARGRCDLALPVLEAGLANHPDRTTLRSRFIECARATGDTAAARAAAEAGIRRGNDEFLPVRDRLRF
ncbi:MAG: tetratricopeptide repeat protein, partial [Gemmatimonadales bacterium]